MKEGFYKLTHATSNLWFYVFKNGTLSLFAHDLLLKAIDFELNFDIKNKDTVESKLELKINTKSLEVECIVVVEKHFDKLLTDKDRKEIDENMKGKQILDINKFPFINFISNTISEDNDCFKINGELTIRDVKKNIDMILKKDLEDPLHKLKGEYIINQTDFGIRPYNTFFGSLGVQDRIRIVLELNLINI